MNLATREHLHAAANDRLYVTASGITVIKPAGHNGWANRRADLKIVGRLHGDQWIVRLDDGRYQATDLGRAELAAVTS